MIITSLQNEQVKHIVALHKNKGRAENREYLVEGKRFVKEALLRKANIKRIYYVNGLEARSLAQEAGFSGIPVQEVSDEVMKKMTATEEPQGILAIIGITSCGWEDLTANNDTIHAAAKSPILLILDNIKDPGNLGTILRTALAADVRRIILTKGTVDLYNPKVLRSSMGAIFSQTILINKEPVEIEIGRAHV
jgi:TrmH family RNA methyltransferase